MRIGIDIDDTIADTFETGLKYAEEFTKTYCHRTYDNINEKLGNIKSHRHWQELFEWNREEELKFFLEYYVKILQEVNVKKDALQNILKTHQNNEIIFITARHDTEQKKIENLTKNWLNKNKIPFHGLFLSKQKLEVCLNNNIDVFIDDSFENCKSVQSGNVKVYLIDHITNRNIDIDNDNIERAYGWNDLYQKIERYKEGK